MFHPDPDESQEEFIERCSCYLSEEGFTNGQAVELCNRYYLQEQEIIDIKTTYELINESLIAAAALTSVISKLKKDNREEKFGIEAVKAKLISSDKKSTVNKLFPKPKGVIVTDTYNNPIFPIELPRVDTSKFNLPEIKSRFRDKYTGANLDYLPWHFVVEFIRSEYFIFNTRPLDMRFPLTTLEAQQLINATSINLNTKAEKFFETKPFNLDQAIHIAIIGDSNTDVYLQSLYEMIGRNCVGPILRYFKISPSMDTRVCGLNLGSKFKLNLLEQHLRR